MCDGNIFVHCRPTLTPVLGVLYSPCFYGLLKLTAKDINPTLKPPSLQMLSYEDAKKKAARDCNAEYLKVLKQRL